MNLASIISLHGRYRAGHPAIESASGTITYRELDEIAARISGGLAAEGISRGDVVGVMLRDNPEHICAVLGIMRRGAVVLPMDWRWKPQEATRAAERFSPRVILVEDGQTVPGNVATVPISSLLSAEPDPSPPATLDREAPFLYAITSGTTGESKAAVITHRQMYARFVYFLTDLSVSKDSRFCCVFPLAYAAGRAFFLAHLLVGATFIVFPTMFDPRELVAAVKERNVTSLGVPPHVSRALLKLPKDSGGPLMGGLRSYISMTSGLRREETAEIRRRISPALVETYANMVGGLVTVLKGEDFESAPASVGRPVHGAEVEIVDDADCLLPAGEIGQLRQRGPGVASGFLIADAASNEKFHNGWFYPGDIGSIDSNGLVYLHGRSTEIIKWAGMTIFALEVERAIADLEAVAEVAVVGMPSKEFGEEVVAFVVLHAPIDQAILIAHCRRTLATYKVPRRIIVVETLPRNTAGKVVKANLLEHPV